MHAGFMPQKIFTTLLIIDVVTTVIAGPVLKLVVVVTVA
jgi:hypothetical protein